MKRLAIFLVSLIALTTAHAVERTAASASYQDVKDKVLLSDDGDTVIVPATTVTPKTVTDGVTNRTNKFISDTADFVPGDVGGILISPAFPVGTTIAAFVSEREVTVSTVATNGTVAEPVVTGVGATFRGTIWTSQLSITKMIQLIGSNGNPGTCGTVGGTCGTVIADGYRSKGALIDIALTNGSKTAPLFRFAGFEFVKGAGSGAGPRLNINGSSIASQEPLVLGCISRFRMDHIYLRGLNSVTMQIGNIIGVVDHVRFESFQASVNPYHTNWTPPGQTQVSNLAHGSWADDPYWGSNKFLFFEDCDITKTGSGSAAYGINAYQGSRIVIRYCTFRNGSSWDAHGSEGRAPRGGKQIEAYRNTLLFPSRDTVGQLRSGTGIYHNNTLTNSKRTFGVQIYRMFRNESWGPVTGKNKWDWNPDTTPAASGTIASFTPKINANNPARITPTGTPGWAPGAFNGSDGFSYQIINPDSIGLITAGGSDNVAGYRAHTSVGDNTSNELILDSNAEINNTQIPGQPAGTRTWSPGQRFEVWRVRAPLDGVGWGKGRLMKGDIKKGVFTIGEVVWADGTGKDQPASFPQKDYPSEPCYSWNNPNTDTVPGGEGNGQVGWGNSGMGYFKAGRDFFNLGNVGTSPVKIGPCPDTGPCDDSKKYIYTPYKYPHDFVEPPANADPLLAATDSASFTKDSPSSHTFTDTQGNPDSTFTISTPGTPIPGLIFNDGGANSNEATLEGAPTTVGTYTRTITATNTYGGTSHTSSQVFTLTVNNVVNPPPTVALTSPTPGATFTTPANVTIAARAKARARRG